MNNENNTFQKNIDNNLKDGLTFANPIKDKISKSPILSEFNRSVASSLDNSGCKVIGIQTLLKNMEKELSNNGSEDQANALKVIEDVLSIEGQKLINIADVLHYSSSN